MNQSMIVTVPEDRLERLAEFLAETGAQHQNLDEFLQVVLNGTTRELANNLEDFFQYRGQELRIKMDPENWSFEQKREFHRLTRTHIDWTGNEADQPHGWDTQEEWDRVLLQFPSLTESRNAP